MQRDVTLVPKPDVQLSPPEVALEALPTLPTLDSPHGVWKITENTAAGNRFYWGGEMSRRDSESEESGKFLKRHSLVVFYLKA